MSISPLNALEYVSTNFDGVSVTGATWTRLDVKLPNQATPWYQFVGSGAVDLSAYTGKMLLLNMLVQVET
jgi:hypothetical protein